MPYKDKDKQREYQKRWMRSRRSEFFADRVCEECGSSKNLQLHHIDPSKKEQHRIWSWSQSHRDKEIEKCSILCSKCHRKKHASKAGHGTTTKYSYGCRCNPCKAAKAVQWKNYSNKRNRRLV